MKTAFFWLLWVGFTVLCALAAMAINDYQAGETARLERVHAQGMYVGHTLCAGGRQ